MEDLILVKKIDPNDKSDELYIVSFGISNIQDEKVANKVSEALKNFDYINRDSVIFRYNGIELRIAIKYIPELIKALVEEGIGLYSVFIKYETLY